MKITIALISLLLSLPLSAQTFNVIDNSPSDSPIKLRGTVRIDSADPASNVCSLTWHNSGSKTAVAWRWDMDMASPDAGGAMRGYKSHDHFFRNENILLALSVKPQSDAEMTPLDLNCSTLTSGFQLKTLWVQFIDGSTWGDAAAESEVMARRTNALDLLKALEVAYSNGGPGAFQQVLESYDSHGGSMRDTLRRTDAHSTQLTLLKLKSAGAMAQLAEVNRMLSVAGTRTAWLK